MGPQVLRGPQISGALSASHANAVSSIPEMMEILGIGFGFGLGRPGFERAYSPAELWPCRRRQVGVPFEGGHSFSGLGWVSAALPGRAKKRLDVDGAFGVRLPCFVH